MPLTALQFLKGIVNFFYESSVRKQILILITIFVFGLTRLIIYYDGKIRQLDLDCNVRVINLTDKLEEAHKANDLSNKNIIKTLQESYQKSEEIKLESERMRLEFEKFKNKQR